MTKFKTDRKIIIERDRNRLFSFQKNKRRGYLSTPDEDDYLKRRIKKGTGITFFDAGYWRASSGSPFQSLQFSVIKDIEIFAPSGEYVEAVPELELADYQMRDALIFAVPMDQWKSTFKPISKTLSSVHPDTRYQLGVQFADFQFGDLGNPDFDEFSGTTLQLSDEELAESFVIYTDGFYFDDEEIYLSGDAFENQKITAVNDFNADPAAFTPSSKMDIYLMPAFVLYRGFHENGAGDRQRLNQFHQNYSREQFLEHHETSDPLFVPFNGVRGAFDPAAARVLRTTAFMKALPDARSLISESNGDETYTASVQAASVFENIESGEYAAMDQAGFGGNHISGTLLCVINKDGNWFYVWKA